MLPVLSRDCMCTHSLTQFPGAVGLLNADHLCFVLRGATSLELQHLLASALTISDFALHIIYNQQTRYVHTRNYPLK